MTTGRIERRPLATRRGLADLTPGLLDGLPVAMLAASFLPLTGLVLTPFALPLALFGVGCAGSLGGLVAVAGFPLACIVSLAIGWFLHFRGGRFAPLWPLLAPVAWVLASPLVWWAISRIAPDSPASSC